MTKTKAEPFGRRRFLRAMTVAAGTASFPPQVYGAVGSAVAITADVEEAPSETGQTTRLAEYAVRLRYEDIPSDGGFVLVETSTLIPVCSSTRSLKFRPFRGSYERRCSLTKPPRLPLVVSTNGASAWFG